jgi:hypothetical protein
MKQLYSYHSVRYLVFCVGLLWSTVSFAQTVVPPQGINYQAIARDTAGFSLSNCTNLSVKFTIYDSIQGGNAIFTEIHPSVSTNRYGLFTTVIGSINTLGFDAIVWAVGNKFIEVGIDSGGTGFFYMPRTQLISVPYALHSKTALYSYANWALTGNQPNSTHFIGTTNNAPLLFRTANVQRMILDSIGRLGIGTNTPSALLELAGQIKITGGTPGLNKVLTSDAAGLASWVTPVFPYVFGNGLSTTADTINSVWTSSGATIYNNNPGNVGVGTTLPTMKLEVVTFDSSFFDGFSSTRYANQGVTDAHIWLRRARGTEGTPAALQSGDEMGFIKFRGYDSNNGFSTSFDQTEIGAIASENFTSSANGSHLIFMTTPNGTLNGLERMRISQNGRVGIGTNSPASKLDVEGTVTISGNNSNELNRTQTGAANLVPIAFGNIPASGNGSNISTGNFSVNWNGTAYIINITGESYDASNYITLVTPINNNAKPYTDDDGNGKLKIVFFNPLNSPIQSDFQFIVYKP